MKYPGIKELKGWESIRVSSNITAEQVQILSALPKEEAAQWTEEINGQDVKQKVLKIALQQYSNVKPIQLNTDYFDGIVGQGDMVVNSAVGAYMLDLKGYEPIADDNNYSAPLPYQIGVFHGYRVWVDPFMSFKDGRIFIVAQDVVEYFTVDDIQIVSEATFAPNAVQTIYIKKTKPKNPQVFEIKNISELV